MLKIAIVGSAEVVLRAIGNKLEGDIQKSLDRAAKGARSSGRNTGKSFGDGVSDGINLSGGIASKLNPPNKDVNDTGQRIGKRLGDQIGKGVEKSRMRSSFLRAFLKLGVVIPIIATLIAGISTLVSGLFSMAAAAGTAASALVVFPGILAAIGQGAVVATVGFKGVGEAISQGFDPSKAKQFQESLAKLPPSAQAFVKEFLKFRDAFKGIRAAASEGLFDGPNGLTASLKRLEPLLPRIASGFRTMGQSISAGLDSAFDRLTSESALENFSTVAENNNVVIRELGKTLGNFGAVTLAVLGAAGPLIVEFSNRLTQFSQSLRETTEAAAEDGSLAAYFGSAAIAAKTLIGIVGNVFEGLRDIGQVAAPFGLDLLFRLEDLTEKFANFTDNASNVDALQGAFAQIHDNMIEIGLLVRDVGAAFLRMGASPAVGNVAEAIRGIVPELETLLTTSLNVVPAIVNLVGNLAHFFTVLAQTGAIEVFVNTLNGIVVVVSTLVDMFSFLIGPLAKVVAFFGAFVVVGKIVGFFSALTGAGAILGNIFRVIAAVMGPLVRVLMPLFARGLMLIGLAMRANPIGAIVTALTLLAIGFRYAWTHSETFRKIIVGALKGVVTYFDYLLMGWQAVLGALGKVPKFEWAKKASNEIGDFRVKLDGAKGSLDNLAKNKPNVDVNTKPANEKLKALKDTNGFQINGSVDIDITRAITKLDNLAKTAGPLGAVSGVLANVSRGILRGVQAARANGTGVSGATGFGNIGSGGGGGGGSKEKEKKEKKEKEKKEGPLVDLRPVFQAIKKDTDEFRQSLNTFIQNLRENGEWDAVRIAQKFRARMDPFLKALDTARDKIKAFSEQVKEIRDGLIDRANIFSGGGDDKKTDFGSIVEQLTKSRTETIDLTKALQQLRGLGLNNTMVQQLAQAGPDGLKQAASIVQQGKAGVDRLNKLQAGIAGAANNAGREAAAAAGGAGGLTATAFINGIIKQRNTLQAQLDILGRSMGKQIALTLKKDTKAMGLLPRTPAPRVSTSSPARGATPNTNNTVNVNQIYNGPMTGSLLNRELEWTLRYASPTSAPQGATGSSPVAVGR